MKKKTLTAMLLTGTLLLNACSTTTVESIEETAGQTAETSAVSGETVVEVDIPEATDFTGMTAEQIVASLTLEQKAAQMVQGALYNLDYDDMEEFGYGSVLSHYSLFPELSVSEWRQIIDGYQDAALAADAGIPMLYGNDSVHGVNFTSGCVIFPHNINIGAANDPELTEEYGAIVGSEMIHAEQIFNFAPVVNNCIDPRWGRTYECYSSEFDLCDSMATAFITGQLSEGVIVCPKHFFAEGYVVYGTGENSEGINRLIDRGDSQPTQEQIDACLAVYQHMIDLGAQTIMISHTSLWGTKMHENAEYIWMLKNDFGFEGFIISDWDAIEKCSGSNLYENVCLAVNAGIDMLMEAGNYEEARQAIVDGVENGDISEERVDDAVRRIIQVKLDAGLFDDPYIENFDPTYSFNSDRSHEVARLLAAESIVPMKLGDYATIEPGMRVLVMGPAADDTGVLCGGWTYGWEGCADSDLGYRCVPEGVTILEGLQAAAEEIGFEVVTDPDMAESCDLVVLCIGEYPYAEWNGDTASLSITEGSQVLDGNAEAIRDAEDLERPIVTLVVAGRNMIVEDYIDEWDSCYFCYLPGSEGGNGIADILVGNVPMTGTLPMPYYTSEDDIGTDNFLHDVGWSAAN